MFLVEKSNVFKNLYYQYFGLKLNFYDLKVSFVPIKLDLILKPSSLTHGFAGWVYSTHLTPFTSLGFL